MSTLRQSTSGLFRVILTLVVSAVLIVAASPAIAGDTGVLKLKVKACNSLNWIVDGRVDVEVTRPGGGTIDTATGYTDDDGYVELTLTNLEEKDIAHVTVTPVGQSPDSNHTYYWVVDQGRTPGWWDLGGPAYSLCSDGWYDEGNDIILCMY